MSVNVLLQPHISQFQSLSDIKKNYIFKIMKVFKYLHILSYSFKKCPFKIIQNIKMNDE